ncbi:MAG: type II toxin-antitoxin system PemK/MazF family toxin [Myxococcota bacterium]|nr:type II toxin-antitoxin system PemK/MazF family toxin [Myxococcota bacterium]
MRRGEVWWARLPGGAGRRPILLLTRDEAYAVRELVTIAPITTRKRNLPVEVPLAKKDGLPKACVVNLDTITTIPKKLLENQIVLLRTQLMQAVDDAIRFALGLDD